MENTTSTRREGVVQDTENGQFGPALSPEKFEQSRPFALLTMNTFLLDYLHKMYEQFNGDILQALVLGVIAHHNFQRLAERREYEMAQLTPLLHPPEGDETLTPCNAFSISEALNIPRETVRRKVVLLVKKGLLRRNEKKELFVTSLPSQMFREFNFQLLHDFLLTADRLRAYLDRSPAGPADEKNSRA